MSAGLKLTVYHGERDRVDGGFLADALVGVFARHELRASVILRGVARGSRPCSRRSTRSSPTG